MRRIWLIAWREITAYAGTLSFWLALVAGPVLILIAAMLTGPMMTAKPTERTVAIAADDAELARAARESLTEAARLQGRAVQIAGPAEAQTQISIAAGPDGLAVSSQGLPISQVEWALLSRDLSGGERHAVTLRQAKPQAPDTGPAASAGRFAMVVLLWMNLVGALGMLLQAIVRERANRALEILLTSARPLEIVLGKLIGVAALSCIVVAGWLSVGAGVAAVGAVTGRAGVGALLAGLLVDPAQAALAGVVYVLAFLMYGAAILGLSALSKDMPAAQNASRPVFGLLLIAFFAAMGMMTDAARFGWLLWAPPLTPFVLLMQDPAELGPWTVAGALLLMSASSLAVFALAARGVSARPSWRAARAAAS